VAALKAAKAKQERGRLAAASNCHPFYPRTLWREAKEWTVDETSAYKQRRMMEYKLGVLMGEIEEDEEALASSISSSHVVAVVDGEEPSEGVDDLHQHKMPSKGKQEKSSQVSVVVGGGSSSSSSSSGGGGGGNSSGGGGGCCCCCCCCLLSFL